MKLQRFTALDNHRAILMVHEKLGPDALVYSTRRIATGVEVLAGLSHDNVPAGDEVQIENTGIDRDTIDKLNTQLQVMEETIQKLSTHITMLYQVVSENLEKKKSTQWKVFKHIGRIRKQRGTTWNISSPLI